MLEWKCWSPLILKWKVCRIALCQTHWIFNQLKVILNCARNHWVCVSTFGCPHGKINVFDSNRTGDISLTTREAIATLLNTTRKLIYLVFPDVQRQCNQSECRLFALAFASNVCQNVDPVTISYDQKCFCFHFLKCLENNLFEPFPCSPKKQPPCNTLIKFFKVFWCLSFTGHWRL